jgi:hypothetical protein
MYISKATFRKTPLWVPLTQMKSGDEKERIKTMIVK